MDTTELPSRFCHRSAAGVYNLGTMSFGRVLIFLAVHTRFPLKRNIFGPKAPGDGVLQHNLKT